VIDRFPEIEIVNASRRDRANELAPPKTVDLKKKNLLFFLDIPIVAMSENSNYQLKIMP
jgi:hypothetical protein